MQVIRRGGVPFEQIMPGEAFECSVRSMILLKDTRGCAVALETGEVVELVPEEPCARTGGAFVEAGALSISMRAPPPGAAGVAGTIQGA